MLHIANGDTVAGALIHSTVPGEKMAFQEDLTSGPTPAGLSTSQWLRLRADFLTQTYQPAERDVLLELMEQQAALDLTLGIRKPCSGLHRISTARFI
jgi:hypothetical protein